MNQYKKRSIAIVAFLCPYPITDGGRFCTFSFVNDMRHLFDVTLIFKVFSNEKKHVESLQSLWPEVTIHALYTDLAIICGAIKEERSLFKRMIAPVRKIKYRRRAKRNVTNNAMGGHSFYPFTPVEESFVNLVGQIFNEKKFDIIQIEYSTLLNLVHIIPPGAKKVFFQHENRYAILKDYFGVHPRNPVYDKYIVDTAWFTEIKLMNEYDQVIVLNKNDKEELSKFIPAQKLCVVPTTVPTCLIPQLTPAEKPNKLVFLGSQLHEPNLDAVKWYATEMNDAVKRKTGLSLYVTGFWKDAVKFLYPQCVFTGYVENIAEVLQGSILIAPIRLGGGGIRIKVLQAMSCGVPVIATALIVKGMEGVIHGENILIVNTAQECIEAIEQLANDQELYSKISRNAITMIETFYSEKNALTVKEKIFEGLLRE